MSKDIRMSYEKLYTQTYHQILAGALGGGDNQYFQMLGSPQSFTWPVAPSGQIASQAYQIVSRMPVWSEVGNFAAGSSTFFDAYRQVLNHVTIKVSPEKQQDLIDLKDRLTKAENELRAVEMQLNQAYQVEAQNGGAIFKARYPTVVAWLNSSPSAQQLVDKQQRSASAVTALQDQLFALQAAFAPSDLADALAAIQLPSGNPVDSPAPRGWTKVMSGGGTLEFQPDWMIGTTGQDWRAKLSKGSIGAFTVQLDASKSDSSLSKAWAHGSAGYGTPFWGVHVKGSWEKLDISGSDASIQATIDVQSSTIVDVSPGAWYNGGFLRDLARGAGGSGYVIEAPWVARGEEGSPSLFGRYGLLSTQVSGLVVVSKLSVSITMASSTFEQHEQAISASAGLRIGPFDIGGDGGYHIKHVKATSGKTTFTAETSSLDPVIIGVLVAFPGVDKPE